MYKYSRKFYITFFLIVTLFSCCSLIFANQLMKNVEGMLEIRLASFLDHKRDHKKSDIVQYVLKVNEDFKYYLIFKDEPPINLKTGQRIKLRQGIHKTILDGTQQLLISAKDLTIVQDQSLRESPDTFGVQNTLVILANFQNQPSNKPWTIAQVKDTVFDTINNRVAEFSYQQTTLAGDVVGWYTVPLNSNSSCNTITDLLPTFAQHAARSAGMNLELFTRFVYMFPSVSDCPWAGLGTVGGKPSTAWINGVNNVVVTAHEIGHNLGLWHSHSLECPNSSNVGSCTRIEYGDLADTMGYAYIYRGAHFNAFQKERLGWLNFGSSPPIVTVTESGTYTIDNMETNNRKTKALKVVKRSLTNYSRDYYYIEYRKGIGFDVPLSLCIDCDFTQGVVIHQANNTNGDSSDILDMTPLDRNKTKLVTLFPGKTFVDSEAPNGGVTIFVESANSTEANVRVTFGNSPPPPPQSNG